MASGERLARVVTYPNHFRKDGSLKPGLFPKTHIEASGLSLIRADRIEGEELTRQAAAIAGTREGEEPSGVCVCTAERLRGVIDHEGNRSLCVKDDPMVNDPVLPDNPAHAIAIQALGKDESEALRIQGELVRLFSQLTAIDKLYDGSVTNVTASPEQSA